MVYFIRVAVVMVSLHRNKTLTKTMVKNIVAKTTTTTKNILVIICVDNTYGEEKDGGRLSALIDLRRALCPIIMFLYV